MAMMRLKNGATLIELIMVIAVVSILAATTSGILLFFIRLFVYSPAQLETQKIAQVLNHTMIEGTPDVRGIRYTRAVLDATAVQYSYTYGYPTAADQLSVRFRWDSTDDQIFRSTSTDGGSTWSTEEVIPPYTPAATTVDGKDVAGTIFTYKKSNEADWTPGVDALGDIARLVLAINVKTGTGNFDIFEGSANLTTSVEIKDY